MTVKGQIFKSYAEAIVKEHGFGSKKMVKHWSTDFFIERKEYVGKLLNGLRDEESEEAKQGMEIFESLWNGENELVETGYLRRYQPEWYGWKNRKYGKQYGDVYIGLTYKGWEVANKYLGK